MFSVNFICYAFDLQALALILNLLHRISGKKSYNSHLYLNVVAFYSIITLICIQKIKGCAPYLYYFVKNIFIVYEIDILDKAFEELSVSTLNHLCQIMLDRL